MKIILWSIVLLLPLAAIAAKPRTTLGTPNDGGGVDEASRVLTLNRSFDATALGPVDAVTVYDKLTYAGNPANLAAVSDDPRYRFVLGDICAGDLPDGVRDR